MNSQPPLNALDVVTFGEALVLLVADQPGALEAVERFDKRTAGAETNVAIGLSRMGFKVGWASRLGVDSMSRYLLGEMRREGVDCSRVTCVPGARTGFMFKGRVTDGGDPAVEYHRQGSAASMMGPQHIDRSWLLSARHLHATGVFAAVSDSTLATSRQAMSWMKEAGRTVSFDTNLRPSLWASTDIMRREVNHLASLADWVLPGLEEGQLLTGQTTAEGIARFYLDQGAQLVVVKLGPEGAYFESRQSGSTLCGKVAGFAVKHVIDTVGAGDGFAAGVVAGLLDGLPLADAVRRGAWIGARSVEVLGDTEGLPTRQELDAAGL